LTTMQAAKEIGINYNIYVKYEGMSHSPLRKRVAAESLVGDWKPTAIAVARYFGVSPEYIWPEAVLCVKKPKIESELSFDEMALFIGAASTPELPDEAFERKEMAGILREQVKALTEREQQLLNQEFGLDGGGGKMLADCYMPSAYGRGDVTVSQKRQVEGRAMCKLRWKIKRATKDKADDNQEG